MSFISPIWLTALLPWGALTLWLLQARRPRVAVPYLALWESHAARTPPRRRMQTLPWAVVLVLLSALLAILASARPAFQARGAAGGAPITLIVDRGLSMSAKGVTEPRYVETARAMVEAMRPAERSRAIELVTVPGESPSSTTFFDCIKALSGVAPTAQDTRNVLTETIAGRLSAASGPVLVITDAPIPPRDRLIRISPESTVRDAGIALLAAREFPAPQVMVRVRNQSGLQAAALVVSCDGRSERQTVSLPPNGQVRDYFFNPPRLGMIVSAELVVQDGIPADDRAWLVREGSSPTIEAHTPISAELRRLIDAYQRSRPATDASSKLIVVGDSAQLPAAAPAILIQSAQASPASGVMQVAQHPVTAHVAWDQMPMPLRAAGDPPAGWTPLVSIGGRAIIAVRPDGPRQVWVGFDSPNWSTTPDFVVFWTNVFDWAGGGGASYAGHSLADWTSQWKPAEPDISEPGMWPGLYRRSDGALRAFNPPDVILPPLQSSDWRRQLASLDRTFNRVELSGALLVGAAACVVLAAMVWKRRRKDVVVGREVQAVI